MERTREPQAPETLTRVKAAARSNRQAAGKPETVMKTIRRILLLLDERLERTPAVDRAVALCKALGAELWLALHAQGPKLGVLGIMDRAQAHQLEDMMRTQLSERLAEFRQGLLADGVAAVLQIDDRSRLTADRVVGDVIDHQIDLVIKDVGHPSLLRRLVLLPFDWALLRESPVPVWLAGGSAGAIVPKRIVAAVDPVQPEHGAGRLNDALLESARTLAQAGGGQVRVISAFAGLPPGLMALDPMGVSLSLTSDDLYEELRVEHRRALDALLKQHQLPADAALLLYGPPVVTLLEAIEDFRPELLVVGTLQRRGLERVFMGSTVERLIGEAPCDVLTVPAVAAPSPSKSQDAPPVAAAAH
jgi:universal stress protein E